MNTMTLNYAQGGLAAADRIRAQGRGQDSMLVHMTPGEVQALQSMAEQHGGSLTINPQTGLPEAGFLSGLLSVAAPLALSFIPGVGQAAAGLGGMFGASGAMATGIGMGLMTGGLTALATGDLEKGLTSGLTSGLISGAMSGWNPTAASTSKIPTATVGKGATELAAEQAIKAQTSMMQNPSIINAGANPYGAQLASAQQAINAQYVNPIGATIANQAQAAANIPGVVNQAPSVGLMDKASNWWGGLTPMQKIGVGGAGALGLAALTQKKPGLNVPTDKGTIRPYEYKTAAATPQAGQSQFVQGRYDEQGNPVLDTRERNYFNQSFNALPTYAAANGGLMAAGSMDQNNMYPQSQQVHTNFATPTQMPTSAEVVASDYDTKTSPYTGEEMPRMADGGSTNEYTYDPVAQKYNQVVPAAPVQDYSNYRLFGQPGIFGNMVNQLNAQNPGAGDQWAGVMKAWAPGLGQPQASPVQQQSPFGSMMRGLMQQAENSQSNMQQYAYDPQTQQYIKMAEGGDITSGFEGYGQDNQGGRNPLELLKALQASQEQPQQQTTVIRQAAGGLSNLGSYSDGGHLLKGPGDGVSDDIPAMIGKHQPARLADGEFVVPARIVSELGNGSTDAGARRLYDMMDRIQAGRKKSVGKGKVAVDSKAEKHLPA